MPVLSRGKHRRPRKGACFMEFASFLAGERWSDHPACTHPLLASLARLVNDYTSDEQRQKLVGLAPTVVGLTSDDVRVDLRIALRAAVTALPVVAEHRQRSMAATILVANRLLAMLDGRPASYLEDASRDAMEQVPLAARWAYEHFETARVSIRRFRRYGAPAAVLYAVDGIAKSCTSDPEGMLRDLLAAAIADVVAIKAAAERQAPAQPALDLAL
jgi:hypothetical protein